MRPRLDTRVMSVALAVTGILAMFSYADAQRDDGDIRSAWDTLDAARAAAQDLNSDSAHGRDAFTADGLQVDLFLASDAAVRLPSVAQHVARSRVALQAAHELRRVQAQGRRRPPLEQLPAVAVAVDEFPQLGSLLVSDDGVDVVADTDALVLRLLGIVSREAEEGERLMGKE